MEEAPKHIKLSINVLKMHMLLLLLLPLLHRLLTHNELLLLTAQYTQRCVCCCCFPFDFRLISQTVVEFYKWAYKIAFRINPNDRYKKTHNKYLQTYRHIEAHMHGCYLYMYVCVCICMYLCTNNKLPMKFTDFCLFFQTDK